MRWLLRISVVAALVLVPSVTPASAVTIDDLFALRANGLSDDILVALIETDGSSFNLQAADIIKLREAGLSERVLVAMLRARAPRPVASTPAPSDSATPSVIPLAVQQTVTQRVDVPSERSTTVYVPVAVPVAVPVEGRRPQPAPQPVYWGYGGQLRPDAWKPAVPVRAEKPENRADKPVNGSPEKPADKTPADKTPAGR